MSTFNNKVGRITNVIPALLGSQMEQQSSNRTFKRKVQNVILRNRRASFSIRMLKLLLKTLSCIYYVIRVVRDPGITNDENHSCYDDPTYNLTTDSTATDKDRPINYWALLWVCRSTHEWIIQLIVAALSLVETLIVLYANYKVNSSFVIAFGNILYMCKSVAVLLELSTSVPILITLCAPSTLQHLFVPLYLNCWLAKMTLKAVLSDINRNRDVEQTAVVQQIITLGLTFLCLVFTATCSIEHLQRAGHRDFNIFQSFYFMIVTFSTVGYGDFYPDVWMSQTFIVFIICIAFIVIPKQVEQLALTWKEKQACGGDYSTYRAKTEKHVVVCTTQLKADTILDFLNEFYAHSSLQDYFVLLLSPCELDTSMKLLLQSTLWSQRVIFMKGSPLKDSDLKRCQLVHAEACFLLPDRGTSDKNAADQHIILRSWAVRDFAPKCPQFVQIFRPENKVHVKHAEYVVCEDEFKYAMLATNCICPGISTFFTLLLHTSNGDEGQDSTEAWQRLYGRHSGNEVYHNKAGQSKLFQQFIGQSFTQASYNAHRRYNVTLMALQGDKPGSHIQLNPGPKRVLTATDTCYYFSIMKESDMKFNKVKDDKNELRSQIELTSVENQNEKFLFPVESNNVKQLDQESLISERSNSTYAISSSDGLAPVRVEGKMAKRDYVRGFPPVTPYIGTSATLCHLLKEKKPLCCLQLAQTCEHCSYTNASQYPWTSSAIILSADFASSGIYNFIVPLRAYYRPVETLNPIVILLEKNPDKAFLDAISYFPMVYWMSGEIENLDNVLLTGVMNSKHFVIVNKEYSNSDNDDFLADCNTIVAVQSIYVMFPQIHIITELTHSTNMRFMEFNASDLYALSQSEIESSERERGSNLAFMFRFPFAAGHVFSATMLDTLLYQAYVKPYIISIARLLLGIDQTFGSGYLSMLVVGQEEYSACKTYGQFFHKISFESGGIPIGIYRTLMLDKTMSDGKTFSLPDPEISHIEKELANERHEIANLVKNRLQSLGLPNEYNQVQNRGCVSFVIINPDSSLPLDANDLIYVLKSNALV